MSASKARIIIVTGMSGAGKSTTLKTLEDLGYEAIDNIPLHILKLLVKDNAKDQKFVVGVDVRSRNFDPHILLKEIMPLVRASDPGAQLVYLDAEDEVLRRRFSETRRKHPLAADRRVVDGIAQERFLVNPIQHAADIVLDTSESSINDLRGRIRKIFADETNKGFTIHVSSFSYKQGVPRDADIVFDVRFLKNPYYDPELKDLCGRDSAVCRHIETDPHFKDFYDSFSTMIGKLLPRYTEEGKAYLTIAIGCTGGQHRSVFVAEKLAGDLQKMGYNATVTHRDLPPQK